MSIFTEAEEMDGITTAQPEEANVKIMPMEMMEDDSVEKGKKESLCNCTSGRIDGNCIWSSLDSCQIDVPLLCEGCFYNWKESLCHACEWFYDDFAKQTERTLVHPSIVQAVYEQYQQTHPFSVDEQKYLELILQSFVKTNLQEAMSILINKDKRAKKLHPSYEFKP